MADPDRAPKRAKAAAPPPEEKPHVRMPADAKKVLPPETVFCRRVERQLPVHEHVDCPYCCGKEKAVETGEHGKFCDYRKGKDPIHFGFPEDFGRHTQ